ncbi:MAG: hypothetical protein Q4Q32_05850 [Methanobrevibacter sp.]|nr:hypothetical protein [Methanobrevibacter sp.]
MNGMHYDEYSSSTEISSQENLSYNEKINILIDHLKLLSKKYGLGEVNFWYEPFSDNYKMFSVQICPDHSDDERIEVLYKINHEMRDFAKRNNMENFFKYSSIVYDYDVE